jgi:hypothetical protein
MATTTQKRANETHKVCYQVAAKDIKIDRQIEALLPPLDPEEYAGLSTSIQTDGCADSLVVWKEKGVLLDGHNRLRICQEYGIRFTVRYLKLPSRELAIQWVIDNQLGRRNLTDERRAYLRGKEYLNKKQAHGGQVAKGSAQNAHSKTAEQVAEKHGVNQATVRRDAEFAKAVDRIGAADPAAKESILSGKSGQTRVEIIDKASTLCRRCLRVGAVRDCRSCQELRRKATPRGAKQVNGKVVFADKIITDLIGKLVRAMNDRSKGCGGETKEYKDVRGIMENLLAAWKRWQLSNEKRRL